MSTNLKILSTFVGLEKWQVFHFQNLLMFFKSSHMEYLNESSRKKSFYEIVFHRASNVYTFK